MKHLIVGGYRWIFGLAGAAALAQGLVLALGGGATPADYFSYFTILSNILAAGVLLTGAWPWTGRDSPRYDLLRVAATRYILVTGLVYNLLLAPDLFGMTVIVNTVVHRIMPAVVVLDRLINPIKHPPTRRGKLLRALLPLLYVVCTEVRGAIIDWYPYYFLDPRPDGYTRVALYVAAMAAASLLLRLAGTLVRRTAAKHGHTLTRRKPPPAHAAHRDTHPLPHDPSDT
ncbi:Pr6Pr family membrane protein [Streptomyces violascens]|uniref:Pr6Pr family membrane protein n=1 Tax=Streptomyces violascens TaxID=67381 RepID=UPI003669A3EF